MFLSKFKVRYLILSFSLIGLIVFQLILIKNNKPVFDVPISNWQSRYISFENDGWYIDSQIATNLNLSPEDESIEIIYGPFVPISSGEYIIDISYISTSNQSFRPYAFEQEDKILQHSDCSLNAESHRNISKISILENLDSFEIRVGYNGYGTFKIKNIVIRETSWLYIYILRNVFLLLTFIALIISVLFSIIKTDLTSSRFMWLDYAKGLCIICVLLGHTSNFPLHWFVYAFHMPFFFITSGYLFKPVPLIDYIKKLIRSYIIPYLALCLANTILRLPYIYPDTPSVSGCYHRMKSYMIGSIKGRWILMPNCMPLWFLISLAISLLIFRFISYLKNEYLKLTLIVILAIIGLNFNNIATYLSLPKELPWGIHTIFIDISFIYIGYLLRKTSIDEKLINSMNNYIYIISLSAISIIAIIINYMYFSDVDLYFNRYGFPPLMYIGAIGMTITIYVLMRLLDNKKNKINLLFFLGCNSLFYFSFDFWGKTATQFLPVVSLSTVWVIEFIEKIALISFLYIISYPLRAFFHKIKINNK